MNYNRTRELMIERLGELERRLKQIAGIEHLKPSKKILQQQCRQRSCKHNQTCHLSAVTVAPTEQSDTAESVAVEIEEDVLEGQISGSALTPSVVRKMSDIRWNVCYRCSNRRVVTLVLRGR